VAGGGCRSADVASDKRIGGALHDPAQHEVYIRYALARLSAYWNVLPQDLVSAGYCLASEGEHYFVYLPQGGAVDVAVFGGPFTVV